MNDVVMKAFYEPLKMKVIKTLIKNNKGDINDDYYAKLREKYILGHKFSKYIKKNDRMYCGISICCRKRKHSKILSRFLSFNNIRFYSIEIIDGDYRYYKFNLVKKLNRHDFDKLVGLDRYFKCFKYSETKIKLKDMSFITNNFIYELCKE